MVHASEVCHVERNGVPHSLNIRSPMETPLTILQTVCNGHFLLSFFLFFCGLVYPHIVCIHTNI